MKNTFCELISEKSHIAVLSGYNMLLPQLVTRRSGSSKVNPDNKDTLPLVIAKGKATPTTLLFSSRGYANERLR
jgi:hypothetical protein